MTVMRGYKKGDTLDVTVIRGVKRITIKVKLD